MKAIVKYGEKPGTIALKEMPKPKPQRSEVLVRIKATGICHTDISIVNGKYKGRKPVPVPLILGHEGAGIVAEIGEDVKNVSLGDRVVLEALSGCGKCYNCLNGNKNLCADWEHIGITRDGTFAEYIVAPAELAHKLPEVVSFADAACLEPMSLAARTLEYVKPMVGDTAAIIGPGTIGMFHLQALKAAGAKVIIIGIDQDEKRFEIARKLGADHIINSSREDAVKTIREVTGDLGAEIVVETASSPRTVRLAIDIAATRGRIALFGLYPEATVSPLTILRSGLSIYGDVGALPRHLLRAIRWVEQKKVVAEPLIQRRFKLEEVNEAFESLREGETVKAAFEL